MHVFGAFELDIRTGTLDNPASVKIALLRYTRGEDGRLLITPECTSFGEVEGQINSLQDELDEIRNELVEPSRSPKIRAASEKDQTPVLREPRLRGSAASWL